MASTDNSKTNSTDIRDDRDIEGSSPQYQPQYTSGMTPSIITTINNTSPTPLFTNTTDQHAHDNNRESSRPDSSPKSGAGRTVVEPPYYESYIEDSFVGHWEREDDDPDYDYRAHGGTGKDDRPDEEEDESIHPSTIEFDFDSFGPESFIYTPAAATASKTTTQPIQAAEPPQNDSDRVVVEKVDTVAPAAPATGHKEEEQLRQTLEEPQQHRPEELSQPGGAQPSTSTLKPASSPTKVCELKPSPVDYLVDPAQIDLKVIEPYKKVISHAGYCHHFDPSAPAPKPGEAAPAIIVFSACYLPDRSRRDYDYVMDHLFLYVLSSLHELIADDYILIYLHNTHPSTTFSTSSLSLGGASSSGHSANGSSTCSSGNQEDLHQNNLPTFTWMKRCYQMIDRKLRKNLKILYLVKPTFWLKTIVIMCRPFISSKFSKKLRFIENMEALRKCLPVDQLILPASADCL